MQLVSSYRFTTTYLGIAAIKCVIDDIAFSTEVLRNYIDATDTDYIAIHDKMLGATIRSQFEAFWGTFIVYSPFYMFRALLWPLDLVSFIPFNIMRARKSKRVNDYDQ